MEEPGRLSVHGGHKESDTTEWLHFKGQTHPVSHHWSPARTLSCEANAQTPHESSSSHNHSIQLRWQNSNSPRSFPSIPECRPYRTPRAWITAGTSPYRNLHFPGASCASWTSVHLDTVTPSEVSWKDKILHMNPNMWDLENMVLMGLLAKQK